MGVDNFDKTKSFLLMLMVYLHNFFTCGELVNKSAPSSELCFFVCRLPVFTTKGTSVTVHWILQLSGKIKVVP